MEKDLTVLKAVIDADYKRHIKRFESLEPNKDIVFLGDSMIAYFPLKSFKLNDRVHNLGIPGDTTIGVLKRIEQAIRLKPKKLLLGIGLNDFVLTDLNTEETYRNIMNICDTIKEQVKDVEIYIAELTPINKSDFPHQMFVKYRNLDDSDQLNDMLNEQKRYKIIPLFKALVNEQYELKLDLTKDGVHLNDKGYEIYLNSLQKALF